MWTDQEALQVAIDMGLVQNELPEVILESTYKQNNESRFFCGEHFIVTSSPEGQWLANGVLYPRLLAPKRVAVLRSRGNLCDATITWAVKNGGAHITTAKQNLVFCLPSGSVKASLCPENGIDICIVPFAIPTIFEISVSWRYRTDRPDVWPSFLLSKKKRT